MQSEQKTITDKEYNTGKNTSSHAEGEKTHELTENTITNNSSNSNAINYLDSESEHETDNRNEHNTDLFSIKEIMELKELLKVKHKLMEVVNEEASSYNSITNIHSINNNTFDDIQPQTIHVSQKVFKEFKSFTKEHNTTLKQAVSLALMHYMNTYRNK